MLSGMVNNTYGNPYGDPYGTQNRSGSASGKRRILIKDPFSGQVIASMIVSNPSTKKTKTYSVKKKRLDYNFKSLSGKILRAKTPESARKAVSSARRESARLALKLSSSSYDQDAVKSAILHAKRMERVARKKMKHLEQELAMERGQAAPVTTEMENIEAEGIDMEELTGMSEEEMRALMEEMERTLREMESGDYVEAPPMDDVAESMLAGTDSEEDVKRVKNKHRMDETREIVDADMKYLKAMFERLQAEMAQAESGNFSYSPQGVVNLLGVSLEIGGTQVSMQASSVPAADTGASVDVAV